MNRYCMGIDLGGTSIKLALIDAAADPPRFGEVLRVTTPAGDPEGIVAAMVSGARHLLARDGVAAADVAGIGVGAPGPMRRDAGVIVNAPNLPELSGLPLRDRLTGALALPAVLENDANAAAWGEFRFGAGRAADVHSMVLMTLGTGVGGGIVADGQLVHGAHDFAGEVGHMIIHPGGLPCSCGQRGCLEQYASAVNIARRAAEAVQAGRPSALADVLARDGALAADDVNAARARGDRLAAEIWDQATHSLAVACINLQRLLDCQMIVLAGGLTRAGDDLLTPVRRHYAALNWRMTDTLVDIVLACLGDDAGVFGAAGIAWQTFAAPAAPRSLLGTL